MTDQIKILQSYALALPQQVVRRDFEQGKLLENQPSVWKPGKLITSAEDDQNDYACVPLMTAMSKELCDNAHLLLTRGANPNRFLSEKLSAYSAGWSLLSSAWLEPEMVQVIIEGSADVTCTMRPA